jgi:hypothetical protein
MPLRTLSVLQFKLHASAGNIQLGQGRYLLNTEVYVT